MPVLTSLKNTLALLFAISLLLSAAERSRAQKTEEKKEEKVEWPTESPRKAADGADEAQRLRIARYNAALAELQARDQELHAGRITAELLFDATDRMRQAALGLAITQAERIVVHRQARDYFRTVEGILEAKREAGTAKVADCAAARFYRLDAEIKLLEEKEKK